MSFRDAVVATPHLGADSFHNGLGALAAADRAHVECANTRLLCGSVNIDAALEPFHRGEHRWDYAICHSRDGQVVYWVEVHPASSERPPSISR